MQSVSSRIWTRVAVFISYDDNHYTTNTFKQFDCVQIKQGNQISFNSFKHQIATELFT